MPSRRPPPNKSARAPQKPLNPVYPFAAIVGQEELKLALLLCAIEPSIGGVLVMGERGTGKSTAVRALAELLPPLSKVRGCAYNCDPTDTVNLCDDCRARLTSAGRLPRERAAVPVVELPLSATEDRVCGTIDIEHALSEGRKVFEPGLLARANRGFLYIDEVNLLEDHLVDLLLDSAATGQNRVEREGISTAHPARFVLVGSGNPEEGELRPQLLDRFGLYTEIKTVAELRQRVEIVERREAFDRDPHAFLSEMEREQSSLRRRLVRAQRGVGSVKVPRPLVRFIARLCMRLKVDGHRGELTIARAARALAAFDGRREADESDVRRVAPLALRHRLQRHPLEQNSGGSRVEQALDELLASDAPMEDDEPADDDTRHDGQRAVGGRKPSAIDGSDRRHDGEPPRRTSRDAAEPEDKAATVSSRQTRSTGEDGRQETGTEERSAPPAGARLPEGALENLNEVRKPRAGSSSPSANASANARRSTAGRASFVASGGRYARAVSTPPTTAARVALDATIRAAACAQPERRRDPATPRRAFQLTSGDLRFKQFRRKTGTLFIVAVDTSGSMAVNRIGQAKGALAHLLRRSYVNRDRVALITFRERDASVLLPPSQSPARAKRLLDALPVGGATPLSAGLLRALELSERATRGGHTQRIVLLVFTDGRANVALERDETEDRLARRRRIGVELRQLGAGLQRAGVSSVVIDTRNRFTSGGEAESVAQALGARCVRLPLLDAERAVADVLADS